MHKVWKKSMALQETRAFETRAFETRAQLK
jgi:hypothetical protein